MPRFIMMIGLPGSGKSTYAATAVATAAIGCEHISSDAIRKEVFNNETDRTHHQEVFDLMLKRSINALIYGRDVYYDATNLSEKRRRNTLKQIKRSIPGAYCKAIVFAVTFEECCKRNVQRERVVPEHAILRMLKQFNPPSLFEGWNEIEVICNDTPDNLDKKLAQLKKLPHDNPHHKLSVGDHMQRAYDLYCECEEPDQQIATAIKYHDIGKGYCKVWQNAKGEPTPDAHYYYHDNASSYVYLCYCGNQPGAITIAWLIGKHMAYFFMTQEKFAEKYSISAAAKIEIIHKYDLKSEEE